MTHDDIRSRLKEDKIDYKSAQRGTSLDVPPDLTQLSRESRFNVPGAAVTASGFQTTQQPVAAGTGTAPTQVGDVRLERAGSQRWLVVDIATPIELDQWEGVHQVCDTHRAATYMRIGETRYRWEFQLLPEEDASAFTTLADVEYLIRPWTRTISLEDLELVRVAEYTFRAQIADRWRQGNVFILGDAAHLTPPFIGQGMCAGIRDAAAKLGDTKFSRSPRASEFAARAIMTTDTVPKQAAVRFELAGKEVTIGGICKGAGMIAPNMATTLSFVTTDARVPPASLDRALRRAVEPTFNAIAVDGDTSTNDTLAILASARGPTVSTARDLAKLTDALTDLLDDLAHQLMADGEGVHHVVTHGSGDNSLDVQLAVEMKCCSTRERMARLLPM